MYQTTEVLPKGGRSDKSSISTRNWGALAPHVGNLMTIPCLVVLATGVISHADRVVVVVIKCNLTRQTPNTRLQSWRLALF